MAEVMGVGRSAVQIVLEHHHETNNSISKPGSGRKRKKGWFFLFTNPAAPSQYRICRSVKEYSFLRPVPILSSIT